MARNATMGVALITGGVVLIWAAWFTKPPVFGALPSVIYEKYELGGDGAPPSAVPTPGTTDYTAKEIDALIAKAFPAQFVTMFQCLWRRESPSNAKGADGEIGIFQIHPSNFPGIIRAGFISDPTGKELYDIPTNIKAAADFFQRAGGTMDAIARNWTTYPLCSGVSRG